MLKRFILFLLIISSSIIHASPAVLNISKKNYQTLQIVKPVNEETIFDNQGNITVIASLDTDLREGDKLILLLDSKKIAKPQSQLSWQLHNIDRGEHHLQIQLVDSAGKILMHSNRVTVYLHRAIVRS